MAASIKQRRAEQAEAIAELRKILRPGDTVYGIIRSVSKSGMSRTITFYAIKKNTPVYLTGYMAKALGLRMEYGARDAVRVSGCGMDMVFATVYDLSRALYEGRERAGYQLRSDTL